MSQSTVFQSCQDTFLSSWFCLFDFILYVPVANVSVLSVCVLLKVIMHKITKSSFRLKHKTAHNQSNKYHNAVPTVSL